ncbi:hypothetical protein HYH03_013857 [Edaphochlamys debaryana]|uniref:Uncharacterized protein n=1 Tax=Edaphochlamys debaryana TaxID=47281 RepID=A0A835XP11_9CHLO|nr:hypothetical protein HYH03_013857 [Edaphochlamys debaryana]|eukprot:KAG2487578.1 hypothetical protein HYH03_013857 [Edaphochlamys debaryana]
MLTHFDPDNIYNSLDDAGRKYLEELKELGDASTTTEADSAEDLPMGRGAALSWRSSDDTIGVVQSLFEQAGLPADADTVNMAISEFEAMGPDRTEELLARLLLREKQLEALPDPNPSGFVPPKLNLESMTVAFNRDPYGMGPGNSAMQAGKSEVPDEYRPKGGASFELNPKGFNSLFPICAKSVLGIGFDMDISTCIGALVLTCTPAVQDQGSAGIITDKAYYDGEGEESFYKLTISRSEGFQTPVDSSPEMVDGDADMILAPTFAIMFTLEDKLSLDTRTCNPIATMGVPGFALRDDLHGTAWHSVWHIKNVLVPDVVENLAKEKAKSQQDSRNILSLEQSLSGWNNILQVYEQMNAESRKNNQAAFPNYQVRSQADLVGGTVEGVWQQTLDIHPDRRVMAHETRSIDPARLEHSPVWKQGYFEGVEKLQQLMLRTQAYMDAASGNTVVNPHTKAAMGTVAADKQLDMLQQVNNVEFNTVSFSGGGALYTYSVTTTSTISTKIAFSVSFKDMFGFRGASRGKAFFGTLLQSDDENLYGFEIEFNSELLQETERQRTVSFSLSDDDVGDAFLVKVRNDPAFGTPVFETLAGRSSCPYEKGTLQREAASISVLGGQNVQANIRQGDEAVFELLLENDSGTDEQVDLQLGPDLASNSASMALQLMGAPWISPVPFGLRGPFATQTRALVTAKCGPKYPVASVDVVAWGTCDDMELSRTSLTLFCFSQCPQAEWPQAWPPVQPIIFNLSDDSSRRPLTLTLFNPAYAVQTWRTHPRLEGDGARIMVEFTNLADTVGVWSPLRNATGTIVDFAQLENAFGLASFDWDLTTLLDGDYLFRFVSLCTADVGGGTDSRLEGSPLRLLVDTRRPLPAVNSLLPNSMTWLPGDLIWIDFTEPLDCRQPFSFAWSGITTQAGSTATTPVNLPGSNEIIPACEGRRVSLVWNPLARAPALAGNRTVRLQLTGVADLAGNVYPGPINLTFVTGSVSSNATISINLALGPLPTGARRLLFTGAAATRAAGAELLEGAGAGVELGGSRQGPGLDPLALVRWRSGVQNEEQEEEEEEEGMQGDGLVAQLTRRLKAGRALLASINDVIAQCWAEQSGAAGEGEARAPGSAAAATAVVATDVTRDDDLLTLMVELTVSTDPTTGEGADGVTARLVRAVKQPDSCLASSLKERFAGVQALWAAKEIDQQLMAGVSDAGLRAARDAAARTARGLGLAEAWAASVQAAAAAEDAEERARRAKSNPMHVLITGEGIVDDASVSVEAPHARTDDVDHGTTTQIRRTLNNNQDAAARRSADQSTPGRRPLRAWALLAHHPLGVSVTVVGNLVAVGAVAALWVFRRRLMTRRPRHGTVGGAGQGGPHVAGGRGGANVAMARQAD